MYIPYQSILTLPLFFRELSFAFMDYFSQKIMNQDDKTQQCYWKQETQKLWDFSISAGQFEFRTFDDIMEQKQQCIADLEQCSEDLSNKTNEFDQCNGDLQTCTDNYNEYQFQCEKDKNQCEGKKNECERERNECQHDLENCRSMKYYNATSVKLGMNNISSEFLNDIDLKIDGHSYEGDHKVRQFY